MRRLLLLLLTVSLAWADPGWIDVSVPVDPATTPVYPGDPPIVFSHVVSPAKGDVATVSKLEMGAHTGTHIDAPNHFILGGKGIDGIALDKLMGPALVVECTPGVTSIDAAELNKHEWKGAQRILFKTRNSYDNFYDEPKFRTDFAYVAPDAARLLADAGVVLVGIDYQSMEKFGSPDPQTHKILLGKEVVIVEGLDLRQVKAGRYDLICLPALLKDRDGSPTRALLKAR